MAKITVNTGVDLLWGDLEHRSYEADAVRWIPIICRNKGCACVVRVAASVKAAGIVFGEYDACRMAYEQGYRFIAFGSLPSHGTRGLQADLQCFRELPNAS